jgi:hypothetical protein
MCFVDDQEAWAVGRNGVIFHTESGGLVSADPMPAAEKLGLAVFPQPITGNLSAVAFVSLPKDGSVFLSIYNLLGQNYETIHDGWLGSGNHYLPFQLQSIRSGMYLLRLQVSNATVTTSILVN